MPESEQKRAKKRLDNLFSQYIRKRAMQRVGGCERCHTPKRSYKELDCAHFHSRRKYSTRWHELNAVGLCGGCHFYIDSHPQEKIEFFKELLGDGDFLRLNILAEMVTRNSATDYKLIEIYLRQMIKELDLHER